MTLLNDAATGLANLPTTIRRWNPVTDLVVALLALFILAAIPKTAKFAVWAAVAILFLQLTARKG